ncbi:1-deoxy-D-xylulose-5-phosphate synthase [Lentiprolixibacter aurantiacus]|uniref:1-deoxy-D-xylulose-5-phosphate synthase n=1 Tax=Lentiprolixibacter aurantiacus TaxID=2993939 RepID=A0AAE3MJS7_9FLAO|nr:1-deoxy-D-xylulose-5-phosphate synthase [Lentiprolixibacter aurantiacus]MCX2718723.1 1-deoxy-D-xylulose-5-phosphate synthase [Lentiprolixibacter aurantiacus]
MKLLEHINGVDDLRKLKPEELPVLAGELRRFIIDVVSAKQGHLGASLGVVELTIALHYCYNTPHDKLIWDVGHQAYGHKILTGRKGDFESLRQIGGISGFPSRSESDFDPFGTGHSSTSISAILGMAISSQLQGNAGRKHIAVIGDASIASGMAFEGLNHTGVANADVLIVLNDNAIGIDPSVGALKNYLSRTKEGSIKEEHFFESLNLHYTGPVDGHDLPGLLHVLDEMKGIKGPKLLHVTTVKGKGLKKAEEDQVTYHAPGRFDKQTGDLISGNVSEIPKFQDVFGHTIVTLARKNERIVGITPAMPTGSSLKFMMDEIPERAFDVGIAEQHAVTLAAGMAADGLIPFCNIYSTFLQRAYDQVVHDVALQNLPVVFCLDRAGLVGEDGATHHGIYDIACLRCIPNMVICSPMNEVELRHMLYTAQMGLSHPIAIRYPRGRGVTKDWEQPFEEVIPGTGRCLKKGSEIAVLSLGPIGNTVRQVLEHPELDGKASHYDMRFAKPLDTVLLDKILSTYHTIFTVEDGCMAGGFGSAVLEYAQSCNSSAKIRIKGIPDVFIEHGPVEELHRQGGIDALSLQSEFLKALNEG